VVGTEFRGANYAKIADAFGGKGTCVGTEAEYVDALKEALHSGTLTIIEARIDPSQYAAQFDAIREVTLVIRDLERCARIESRRTKGALYERLVDGTGTDRNLDGTA
jgi:TPP-dependent trihydroxycyclohexane-1,2-dione (THcHDO) dehydratase